MSHSIRLTLLILSILLSNYLVASETEDEEKEPALQGDVQLGYIMSSGNSDTTTLNSKLKISYNLDEWVQKFSLEAYSTSDNDITTGERYKADYQLDKKLDKSRYLFGNASYEEDRFSGYENIAVMAVGYGHQLYNKDKTTLDAEVGIGYRDSTLTAESVVPGESAEVSETLLRLAVDHHWHIAKNRSLTSELKIDAGEESVISYFEIGFITMIAGDLSFKAAFEVRHNSDVPIDTENLDTITSINLLYAL
ncbi:MAG: putative salt-induced outer membrane protein [Enterobacterales bacterium]|jgi:putative salt-induced outer membrane protein